jgi:putative cardiolipin synthase
MVPRTRATICACVIIVTSTLLSGCVFFPLPDLDDRAPSHAFPISPETDLGRLSVSLAIHGDDKTGLIPLRNGSDAIDARLYLASKAQRSIDVQYYIWNDDTSGHLLLKALYDAARRGVRVRLLLDDNGIFGLDPMLASLNALPNFEVRIFNPSRIRSPKLAGYIIDLLRMNRRMHNKSFIVDGTAAIIGGRNIGDEYFQVGDEVDFFQDLDVLAIGKVVPDTSRHFDLYWNSPSAYTIGLMVKPQDHALDGFLDEAQDAKDTPDGQSLNEKVVTETNILTDVATRLEWVRVTLVNDDPAKALGKARTDQLMVNRLGPVFGDIDENFDIITAYFVPGDDGVKYFGDLAQHGVNVRVLTNALKSTDVAMVHAGYAKYRRRLLKAGVELYEYKPTEGARSRAKGMTLMGSSGTSLHAKTFSIDKSRLFIGSFNFDPRSAYLNCEMGFLIESPRMAKLVSDNFDTTIPLASYQPVLTPKDKIIWREAHEDKSVTTYDKEPNSTVLDRALVTIFGWLPVEWLL